MPDTFEIESIVSSVASGDISVERACESINRLLDEHKGYVDLGYARADIAREKHQGVGEVIYGAGKSAEQIAGIAQALHDVGQDRVLITRLDADKAHELEHLLCDATGELAFTYYDVARIGVIGDLPCADGDGTIVVAAAGTSDLYAAEEAAITAEFLGNDVVRMFDVGVSGIHRLMSRVDDLRDARVVIVVAGMDGALVSVVGGMVSVPVIAVPTSVGYGASYGGLSALLAMLNSCASGVSVVNIDNGFGAGFQASLINHLQSRDGDKGAARDADDLHDVDDALDSRFLHVSDNQGDE